MKKLLVLLGILAAFSFVACDKEADPINPPASDPIENENTGGDSAEDDTPTEIVLFDPATYTGDVGVIEELDGEKYVKVVVDGYNSIIPVDIKGSNFKSIKGNVKVEKGADETATQWAVQFVDADMKQAAAFNGVEFDAVKECSSNWGEDFSYTDWNNGGTTAKGVADCTGIQVYVQHPANNYEALKGCIMYIGKIIAE